MRSSITRKPMGVGLNPGRPEGGISSLVTNPRQSSSRASTASTTLNRVRSNSISPGLQRPCQRALQTTTFHAISDLTRQSRRCFLEPLSPPADSIRSPG